MLITTILSKFSVYQLRPNVHIKDMVNLYHAIINAEKKKVNGEIFQCRF